LIGLALHLEEHCLRRPRWVAICRSPLLFLPPDERPLNSSRAHPHSCAPEARGTFRRLRENGCAPCAALRPRAPVLFVVEGCHIGSTPRAASFSGNSHREGACTKSRQSSRVLTLPPPGVQTPCAPNAAPPNESRFQSPHTNPRSTQLMRQDAARGFPGPTRSGPRQI